MYVYIYIYIYIYAYKYKAGELRSPSGGTARGAPQPSPRGRAVACLRFSSFTFVLVSV